MANKKKEVRFLKIDHEFNLTEGVFDSKKDIIGDACFGEGCLATMVAIRYDGFVKALKDNNIDENKFVALVDEEGMMKELPLNFVASMLCNTMVLGDICIIKVGRNDFTDMYDKEYDFLKSWLSGMIDVVVDELVQLDV